MVLSSTENMELDSNSSPEGSNSPREKVSDASSLPFSLINILKCTGREAKSSGTVQQKSSPISAITSQGTASVVQSIFPILSQTAAVQLPTSAGGILASSLSTSLLKGSPGLNSGLSLASFDPLSQLAALKLLQETSSRLKSTIAVPVPVRVSPYPPNRPTRTNDPGLSPLRVSPQRSSSSEDTVTPLSTPGLTTTPLSSTTYKFSPFSEILRKQDYLLVEKSPKRYSAFQEVSPDVSSAASNADIIRAKITDQVMRQVLMNNNTENLARAATNSAENGSATVPKGNHVCKYCEKTFPSPSHLLIHLRTHSGERPYPCPGCGKTFATRGHLRRHYRIHTGVKPYKCQVCGKAFANQGNLKTHTRLHTGEKPYKCPRCDKAFADAGNLQRHITTHTGVKPYKCVHCNKAFSRSSNLKTHLLTHTGLKPFSCTCCNKSFTRLSYLKAHMKGIRHTDKITGPAENAMQQLMSSQGLMTSQQSLITSQQSLITSQDALLAALNDQKSDFRPTVNPFSVQVV